MDTSLPLENVEGYVDAVDPKPGSLGCSIDPATSVSPTALWSHSSVFCESFSALPWTWTGKSCTGVCRSTHSSVAVLISAACSKVVAPPAWRPASQPCPYTCFRLCLLLISLHSWPLISTQDCPANFRLPKTLSFLPFMSFLRSFLSE